MNAKVNFNQNMVAEHVTDQPVLQIRGLKVNYGEKSILQGIDLELTPDQPLAVIGESGAGKTTLGLSILGLSRGQVSGEIAFKNRDILALPLNELQKLRGREIAMVFQSMANALNPVLKVKDQVAEAAQVHKSFLPKKNMAQWVEDVLVSVELDRDKWSAFPHQLSGGAKQRALIAIAMVNSPDLLILDEPTALQDPLTTATIIRLLKKSIQGRSAIIITHDLSVAAQLSHWTAVLYEGRVIEYGRSRELLQKPRHPYTRGLIRSFPDMMRGKDLQGIPGRSEWLQDGCSFQPRCTQSISICKDRQPILQGDKRHLIACHRGGVIPLLECRNISTSFGSTKVLQDVSCILAEGETLALIGESGSGKTTLARTIMGLVHEDGGEILLEGKTVGKRDKNFYNRVQMICQNPMESINPGMNVLQAVGEPLAIQKIGRSADRDDQVRKVLNAAELPNNKIFLQSYPHHMSGGEAQRVAIARALALEPRLLIADEPTSALDPSVQEKIIRYLLNLQEKKGLALLFISHDIALARKVSDRMAVIRNGRIVETGQTSKIITHPRHPYTRALLEIAAAGSMCSMRLKS